jgi:hypothetical protein
MSYVIFHYVTGVPFDMTNNSGVYDNLTLWEQIDSGAQYTPAKKWLTTLPIVLCVLVSFCIFVATNARDSSPRLPHMTAGRKTDALLRILEPHAQFPRLDSLHAVRLAPRPLHPEPLRPLVCRPRAETARVPPATDQVL